MVPQKPADLEIHSKEATKVRQDKGYNILKPGTKLFKAGKAYAIKVTAHSNNRNSKSPREVIVGSVR